MCAVTAKQAIKCHTVHKPEARSRLERPNRSTAGGRSDKYLRAALLQLIKTSLVGKSLGEKNVDILN